MNPFGHWNELHVGVVVVVVVSCQHRSQLGSTELPLPQVVVAVYEAPYCFPAGTLAPHADGLAPAFVVVQHCESIEEDERRSGGGGR